MRKFLIGALALAGLATTEARAGTTLDQIHRAHLLTCGTTTATDDYSKGWTHGNLNRLAGELCQAFAIATLGEHGRARLIGYPARDKALAAVKSGKIQVLIGDTPDPADATLYRAAYGPTLFEDGQGFLVPKAAGIRRLEDLGVTDVIVGFRKAYEVDQMPLEKKIGAIRRYGESIIGKA